jgi:hypothetical protein
MSETTISQQVSYDPRTNNSVTTTVKESFSDFPSIPSNAIDATKEYSGGVYRVSYKVPGDTSGGGGGGGGGSSSYSYEIRSSLSTEPLLTHPYFQSGGKWNLSSHAKELAEMKADPAAIAKYAERSDAIGEYAGRLNDGVESYFAPSITLHISQDESSLPNLASIGKVATLTNAPNVPSGSTWMLTGCQSTALQSGKWRNVYEYRLSGAGGWDTGIYT